MDYRVGNKGLRALWLGLAVGVLALVVFALTVSASKPAEAAKSGSCGAFSVITGGQTFRGDQDRTIPAARVGQTIQVRGTFVRFEIAASTFAVQNYRLTGARSGDPAKDLATEPTTIFLSKVPLHGKTLTSPVSLAISNEGVVLERNGGGQDIKIQAKDCPQGGLFQMEPEPGIRERNTLAPGFTYEAGTPGQDSPLCFTNGRFAGYDSPEFATLISSTARVATWRVTAGGRVGGVLGEDALEAGCTV
jgi:hypothetical protein